MASVGFTGTRPRAIFGDPRLPERFWDKVHPEPNSGCWLWTGADRGDGYGSVWFRGKPARCHTVTYTTLVGAVGRGLEIDHRCRTRICCNPDHLDPVTHSENIRRYYAIRNECLHGHPLSGGNLIIRRSGARGCRKCKDASRKPFSWKVGDELPPTLRVTLIAVSYGWSNASDIAARLPSAVAPSALSVRLSRLMVAGAIERKYHPTRNELRFFYRRVRGWNK